MESAEQIKNYMPLFGCRKRARRRAAHQNRVTAGLSARDSFVMRTVWGRQACQCQYASYLHLYPLWGDNNCRMGNQAQPLASRQNPPDHGDILSDAGAAISVN
jgi:hypothetical protein